MTSPPEPEAPAPDASVGERVSVLEGKLDQILGMLGRDDRPDPAPEAERPEVNIAEEIRKQLAERDAKAKSKPAEPAAPAKTELAEQPPRAPVRRLTRLIWGDDE